MVNCDNQVAQEAPSFQDSVKVLQMLEKHEYMTSKFVRVHNEQILYGQKQIVENYYEVYDGVDELMGAFVG